MHANEGRPLFIVITGKASLRNKDYNSTTETTATLYEKLKNSIEKKATRTVFEDYTGGVYEFSKRLVSITSKSYLLLGLGKHSISTILIIEDLLYPFNKVDEDFINNAINFLKRLVKHASTPSTLFEVVDVRVLEAPFSLRDVG